MKRVELASPTLRDPEIVYSEFPYNVGEVSYLPQPKILPSTAFRNILASRQSRRVFNPISLHLLNTLLWNSARAITVSSPTSPRWQHRPAPSAGGRHPIDLLIFTEQQQTKNVFLYEPVSHSLAKLNVEATSYLEQFFSSVNHIVTRDKATIIWFGAQFDRTMSRYKDGESLVWRDAGALLAILTLVAECLNLNCCAIGITGEPFISKLLRSKGKVVGVGGVLLGSR